MELNSKFIEKAYTFDYPIVYKNLKIYPIKMQNIFEFNFSIHCLLLDQFNDKDVNENFSILQMSFLDYLFYYNERHPDYEVMYLLIQLLSICLQIDFFDDKNAIQVKQDEKNRHILNIGGVEINGNDFENIRRIICQQNNIDTTIFDLDPLVREQLNKTIAVQNSLAKDETCSLEEQVLTIMLLTGLDEKQIANLSIRKFRKILDRADLMMHYQIYKTAETSGTVTFKQPYPHWLAKLNKNVSHNVTSYESVKQKIETQVC
jgi:hypothetical protein